MASISSLVGAIDVDIDDRDSIRRAASTIAYDMMSVYKGNVSGGIIGVLPGPPPNPTWGYYWWESGAMWGTLIDYWHYTGDSSYNDVASAGILHQVGENLDMMPKNWSQSMGNDDQAFWGMTAMLAAELKFPDPPKDQPQWLALAQAVFNTQVPRIDYQHCGGGLRWQVYPYLKGYNYKNSISNGCYFNIGARLARYTGNKTYADLAEKAFDWSRDIGFIADNWDIYDGAHIEANCSDLNKVQFSYNMAVYTLGAANMYNFTDGSQLWKSRLDGLLESTFRVFFNQNQTAYEVACEPNLTCTTDMFSFKAYLLRWLASTIVVAPYTRELIMPYLRASGIAAAKQCIGGTNGRTCGLSWTSGQWDGTSGVGQEMAAMSALYVNLMALETIAAPVTNSTGGTSVGNPNAGSQSVVDYTDYDKPTTGDRAGAGFLTAVVVIGITSMFTWMSTGK